MERAKSTRAERSGFPRIQWSVSEGQIERESTMSGNGAESGGHRNTLER